MFSLSAQRDKSVHSPNLLISEICLAPMRFAYGNYDRRISSFFSDHYPVVQKVLYVSLPIFKGIAGVFFITAGLPITVIGMITQRLSPILKKINFTFRKEMGDSSVDISEEMIHNKQAPIVFDMKQWIPSDFDAKEDFKKRMQYTTELNGFSTLELIDNIFPVIQGMDYTHRYNWQNFIVCAITINRLKEISQYYIENDRINDYFFLLRSFNEEILDPVSFEVLEYGLSDKELTSSRRKKYTRSLQSLSFHLERFLTILQTGIIYATKKWEAEYQQITMEKVNVLTGIEQFDEQRNSLILKQEIDDRLIQFIQEIFDSSLGDKDGERVYVRLFLYIIGMIPDRTFYEDACSHLMISKIMSYFQEMLRKKGIEYPTISSRTLPKTTKNLERCLKIQSFYNSKALQYDDFSRKKEDTSDFESYFNSLITNKDNIETTKNLVLLFELLDQTELEKFRRISSLLLEVFLISNPHQMYAFFLAVFSSSRFVKHQWLNFRKVAVHSNSDFALQAMKKALDKVCALTTTGYHFSLFYYDIARAFLLAFEPYGPPDFLKDYIKFPRTRVTQNPQIYRKLVENSPTFSYIAFRPRLREVFAAKLSAEELSTISGEQLAFFKNLKNGLERMTGLFGHLQKLVFEYLNPEEVTIDDELVYPQLKNELALIFPEDPNKPRTQKIQKIILVYMFYGQDEWSEKFPTYSAFVIQPFISFPEEAVQNLPNPV